jgi:hypothetical protein
MWGIAFSLNPRNWRLGWSDAMDHDSQGREVCVGRWFFIGPVALTYDYE